MYKKYTFKNGLQLILAPQCETKAVTVLVLFRAGSRYESENLAGISHFLEHMAFKGTLRRPTTLALSKELDKVGAEYNAYTASDQTGYWIKINAEHLDLALDMLSDMLLNAKLEAKEISREKGTIIEEINMYEDNPARYSEILLDEIVFQGNSLGRPVIGEKKTVHAITRNKMVDYKKKYYLPKNMVISVAGNIDGVKTKNLIEKYFFVAPTFKSNNKKWDAKFIRFKPKQTKPRLNLKYKDTEQVHLSFGFVGPSYHDKDLIPAHLLSIILGGSMSSRLFINVRERQGLCYYIHSSLDVYQDTGNLTVKAGLDKNRIFAALELILNELKKIKSKGISQEELFKGKEYTKGKLILDLEDSSAVAEWYGRQQLLIGKIKTPEQKINEIMKITRQDVNRLAQKIFQTKKINLALIGPFKTEKEFLARLRI